MLALTRLIARCSLVLVLPLGLLACQSDANTNAADDTPPLNQTVTLLDGSFQIKIPEDWRVDAQLSAVGFIDIYSSPLETDVDPRRGQVIAITIGRESEAPDGDSITSAVENAVALDFTAANAPAILRLDKAGLDAARVSTAAVDPDGTTYYLDVLGFEAGELHIIMTAFDFEDENGVLFKDIFDSISIEPANLEAALFPAAS